VGYQRSLVLAGAIPMVFSRVPGGLGDQLDRVDGVMLAAGHDIDPGRYGQEPHALIGPIDAARDGFEIELVERAVDRGLPIIGTCRGMQVLNVALGGTMVQDLSLVEAWRAHPSDPTGRYWRRFQTATMAGQPVPDHPRHPIASVPGTRLHDLLGDEASVDSFHHQAVDEIGDGLVVSARAPDGVIEALEMPGRFALAMQCELHEEWRIEPRLQLVVEAFVAAAGARVAV
jgi:gamma-glutamyl-gamma-aminobutyrate hydrolase PuuD